MAESAARRWDSSPIPTAILAVIAVVLVGWALRATYVVSMPLAFAFFLAVLMQPVKARLDRLLPRGLRWLSLIVTMLLVLATLGLGIGGIWLSVQIVSERAPEYVAQLQERWERLLEWAQEQDLAMEETLPSPEDVGERLFEALTFGVVTTLSVLAYMVLIFFLVLLMLVEALPWHAKVGTALRSHASTATHVIEVVANRVRRYLLIRIVVSAITGVAIGLWTWAVGVDFALVWGLLAFVLNFVPYIGSIVAVIPPALLAFLQLGLGGGLLALGGLGVIQQTIGNFIDPRLQGRVLQLSPLVVLVSILLWGWMWGIVGALLAVPITVVIVISCGHVPALRPVAILLSRSASEEVFEEEVLSGGPEAAAGRADDRAPDAPEDDRPDNREC